MEQQQKMSDNLSDRKNDALWFKAFFNSVNNT